MPAPLADSAKLHLHVQVVGYIEAGGGDAQDTVLDLFFHRTAQPAPFVAANFRTALHTKMKTELKAVLSDQWTWLKTRVRVLNSATEAWAEFTVNETGAITGDACKSDVAAVIAKYSAYRGRQYQGRMFLSPLGESQVSGNSLEAAAITAMEALAAKLDDVITDSDGNAWTPGILSRIGSAIKMTDNPIAILMTDISSLIVRPVLGGQKQRKSRVY